MSACTAERSLSSMKRLKTPLRSTMTDERLSSLGILHIHKHKDIDDVKNKQLSNAFSVAFFL